MLGALGRHERRWGEEMFAVYYEWASLALRWTHIITGIAWIGASFYFMHLDASLRGIAAIPAGKGGEAWEVHGGGFYQVRKYLVAPDHLPEELLWHKWQAYMTWVSGFCLLALMYYYDADLYLIDPAVRQMSPLMAAAVGVGSLAVGWFVYDWLVNSPLAKNEVALAGVGFAFVMAMALFYQHMFSGRGALIHTGALMGTMMVGNVFMNIMPNQRKVVADLVAGRTPNPEYGKQAKLRSTHNNYLTLPVLFLMLSSHFPLTYTSPYAYVMVGLILVAGALIRHFYNVRHAGGGDLWWAWFVAALCFWLAIWISAPATAGGRAALGLADPQSTAPLAGSAKAPQAVADIVTGRCAMCHGADPHNDYGVGIAPKGVLLELARSDRALARARRAVRGADHCDAAQQPHRHHPGRAQSPRPLGRDAMTALAFGDAVTARIDDLAHFTDGGRLTRLYLTPPHRQAADRVAAWMREAGMRARLDATGSVVGRYEGATPDAPALLLGSHIDTVRDAGRFDGNLGVVVALALVQKLHREGRRLPFALEVLAFGDEEGVRFASTLGGSRAIAGRFDPAMLEEKDSGGVTRRQALKEFGCDPERIASEARAPSDVLGYVELHIEQGPVLEAENLPVGVVTAINGATRGTVTVTGVAGHAGTVPMALRRDAIAAAAEMILAVEARARAERDLVGTVGRLILQSPATNTIAGQAAFSIDVRAPSDSQREAAVGDIETAIRAIAKRRGVEAEVSFTYRAPAAACDAALTDALAAAVARQGFRVLRLPSGAGHDAMALSGVLPFAMLFVRCKGGVSHNPAEYASPEDIDAGARALFDFLEHFGGAGAA